MIPKQELVAAFRSVGLCPGDLVLVHSALRKLGPVEGGADTIIDALLDVVGASGTVAVPTHTWKTVSDEQPVFDPATTLSNVGTLPNVFWKRPGAVRGLHVSHSVAAIGRRAAEFVAGHEKDDTPCSETSPYGKLRDWGGKVMIIGVGLECCTFFHGCEQWAGMPWAVSPTPVKRFIKAPSGELLPVLARGHIVSTWNQYPNLEPHLVEIGALKIGRIRECPLRLLEAQSAAAWVVEQLRKDPKIILPEKTPPAAV